MRRRTILGSLAPLSLAGCMRLQEGDSGNENGENGENGREGEATSESTATDSELRLVDIEEPDEQSLQPTESYVISAVIENTGTDDRTSTVEVLSDGEVIGKSELEIPASRTRTAAVELSLNAPGQYPLALEVVSDGTGIDFEPLSAVTVTLTYSALSIDTSTTAPRESAIYELSWTSVEEDSTELEEVYAVLYGTGWGLESVEDTDAVTLRIGEERVTIENVYTRTYTGAEDEGDPRTRIGLRVRDASIGPGDAVEFDLGSDSDRVENPNSGTYTIAVAVRVRADADTYIRERPENDVTVA